MIWLRRLLWVAAACAPAVATAQSGTVTAIRNLVFGTVFPGFSRQVDVTSVNSAQFRFSAEQAFTAQITFTLPTTLLRIGGGSAMSVSFCSICGVYQTGVNNPVGGTTFDPATGISSLSMPTSSDTYFWLGATAFPSVNQQAGAYTGTIVITVAPLL